MAMPFFLPDLGALEELLKKIHIGNHREQLDHIMNGNGGGFLLRVATEFQVDPAILHSWLIGLLFFTVIYFLLFILCCWISCRFFFVFLDDLVQDKNKIRKPWREFKKIADSYYLGTLVFLILIFAINLLFIAAGGFIVRPWLSECAAARPVNSGPKTSASTSASSRQYLISSAV